MIAGFPVSRVLLAGLVASIAMLGFMFLMPKLGLPQLDVFTALSTLTTQYGQWVPEIQYAILSVFVFPLIYAALLYKDLPGQPWQKGVVWGLILFALRGMLVMPIMGQGFFGVKTDDAVAALVQLLIAHCVYGFILGALMGTPSRAVAQPAAARRRAAGRR